MAQSNGDELLREQVFQVLVTQGQDQAGIVMGRRSTDGSLYKSRTDEHLERIMGLIEAYRKQHELEARKPYERMLEKLGVEKCQVCKDFMIDDDMNICEGCNYGVHEWCTGYTYDGDGEHPAESAYAICKTCYKPEELKAEREAL